MADPNNRQHLPPTSQPFTFVSAQPERREPPRNYVFVDEQNRQRRLKVVRACEGCRKRKIKCDAANTNTWPCTACIKQKMNCIPPSMSFDGDDQYELDRDASQFYSYAPPTHGSISPSNQQISSSQAPPPHMSYGSSASLGQVHHIIDDSSTNSSSNNSNNNQQYYSPDPPYDQYNFDTSDIAYPSIEQPYAPPPPAADAFSSSIQTSRSSDSDWKSDTSDFELTEALGDLKISDAAVAPYMVNQRGLAEAPAVQEEEILLPPQVRYDSVVRIPDSMMPSDQVAMEYFQYFFKNVHPYVPVLYPPYFYKQWHQSKSSISPLILEGIFACCTYLLERNNDASNQWLALAAKHEESFRDVPRLSTLQGMLILMKARESVPRRGYFYRSWMMVVNMIAIAKDLDLQNHNELHDMGKPCDLPSIECIVQTRAWNVLYVIELMIGGPQGRMDFSVSSDTVDFDGSALPLETDHDEVDVSLQFTQFMRVIRNIRETARVYVNLRRKKTDWALDPDFIRHNAAFSRWIEKLPPHFQVSFPQDGSVPWVSSHFVANVNTYHRLSIIMHHRPQLQQLDFESFDGSWKNRMQICYQAAKDLCRLQEAVFQQYGLTGLLCMQRGVGFHLYAILTCTMLHLIAVTSPHPDINERATEYFVRHMRLLEHCSAAWPMKEMQDQIDSLRQAFSADLSKPFELRSNFPGSPPPRSDSSQTHLPSPPADVPFSYGPGSSGLTAAALENQGLRDTSSGVLNQVSNRYEPHTVEPQTYWNPSRIMTQWDAAFGAGMAARAPSSNVSSNVPQVSSSLTPPAQIAEPTPATYQPQQMQSSVNQYINYQQADPSTTYNTGQMPQMQGSPSAQASSLNWTPPAQSFITPSMWQQAVASTYGEGQKRRWNDTSLGVGDRGAKRMR